MITKILEDLAATLEAKNGENILTLDLRNKGSLSDAFVLVTGNSEVHMKTLIETAEELVTAGATISNPKFKAWKTDTLSFLEMQYGKDSVRYLEFKKRMCDSPRAAGLDGNNVILRNEMETTIIEFQEYLDRSRRKGRNRRNSTTIGKKNVK